MLDKVHETYGRVLAFCFNQDGSSTREEFFAQVKELCAFVEACGFHEMSAVVRVSTEDLMHIKQRILEVCTLSEVTKVWLNVILNSGRLRHLLGALLVCRGMIMRGREVLCVESAHALSADEKKKLELFGKKKLGEHAGVTHVTNPDLLAGVRLRKGWREVDLSLQSHIIQTKEDLYRC